MSARAQRGFTLMETLVMLVLVSFAVTLMFQMLGNYRIAKERSGAQAGQLDRRVLMEAWFRESVEALYPLDVVPLQGTGEGFSALSLGPLRAPPGAPVLIGWATWQDDAGSWLAYSEEGEVLWKLELRGSGSPRFQYIDAEGEEHDRWPPALGVQEVLPAAVALSWSTGDAGAGRLLLASVRHSREPRFAIPFESEAD